MGLHNQRFPFGGVVAILLISRVIGCEIDRQGIMPGGYNGNGVKVAFVVDFDRGGINRGVY